MSDQGHEHRKLAAIMFSDMVGYSAIAQRNETLAVALLEEQRKLVRAILPDFEGREIETAGDSFFVDFASAVQATRCAIQIQRTLHERNEREPKERQVLLRIGLHVGDVIVTQHHVVGDGVNIAARLEPLAVPGGICLSEDVARQIRNKVELTLRPLPVQTLKNILHPIGIYTLDLPWLKETEKSGPGENGQEVGDHEIAGQTISHYRIIQELGRGGMGVVYKAEDVGLHRTVALKLLPQSHLSDPESKARFAREAQAAARLQHPNIATVYEFDEASTGRHDDKQAFIAMEYIDGVSLKDRLDRGVLSIDESVNTVIQLARGLQTAHQHGVVHRDLKPANIMIDTQGVLKILDFGVAHLADATGLTDQRKVLGSIPYMSPEQIQGLPVDHRSDLFTFGVLLFEMVTGKRPFAAEHEAALFYSIVNLDPTPPSMLRPETPQALETIILRLLQKDPSKRFQTADDVLAELVALPPTARRTPISMMTRIARTLRKRSLLIPVLLVFLVVSVVLWFTLRHIWQPAFRLEDSRYVFVAEFENRTDNRFFDHSLTEAMKVALRQSPRLNLFPSDRIPEALQTMGLPPDHRLDERTALQLAQRQGAQMLVAGSIGLIGNSYVLTCKVIDAVSGEPLELLHRQTPEVENILSKMDELCKDVRERVGESAEEIRGYSMPLEKVTTPSLEALELYSRGEQMERQGKYQEAAFLKGQAVAIDSLFTFAVSDLSYIHRKLGHDSIAIAYHKKVPSLLNRVTARERYAILTKYYGPSFEFDFQKAFENAEQMALLYPNDAETHAELGHLAMYSCQLTTALEENEKALTLDPKLGSVYNNSGYSAALAGNVEEALAFFEKSKQLRPTYYTIDTFIGHALWVGGELDSAAQVLRSIIPRGDLHRQILSHAQLATLYLSQGRLGRAGIECNSGLTLCSRGKTKICEAYFHYLLGGVAFEQGNGGAYAREMGLAEVTAQAPFTDLALIAVRYAGTGNYRDARRLLSRIERIHSADPYFIRRRDHFLHWVKGEILLSQQKTDQAKHELQAIEKIHCGDPIYFWAQWGIATCLESSSDSLAILHFLRLLDRRGELIMGPLLSYPSTGSWTSHIWPEALLSLGKLYVRIGNRVEGLRKISAAVRYWQGADPIFRKALEAKALMDKLQESH